MYFVGGHKGVYVINYGKNTLSSQPLDKLSIKISTRSSQAYGTIYYRKLLR